MDVALGFHWGTLGLQRWHRFSCKASVGAEQAHANEMHMETFSVSNPAIIPDPSTGTLLRKWSCGEEFMPLYYTELQEKQRVTLRDPANMRLSPFFLLWQCHKTCSFSPPVVVVNQQGYNQAGFYRSSIYTILLECNKPKRLKASLAFTGIFY